MHCVFLKLSVFNCILVSAIIPPVICGAQQKVWALKDCINLAFEKNISLQQDILNNEINNINYLQSKSNAIPNLNLSDGQSNYFGGNNSALSQNTSQSGVTNNLSLSSSVILFNGLKNINLIRANKESKIAGNLDVEKLKNDLMLNVVAAYMQVLFEYEAVDMAQSQIDVTKEHLDYTEKYVKAGSLPESNLFQIKAQLATDKATKVNAENQLQMAKVILMQFMETPITPGFEIARSKLPETIPDVPMPSNEIYALAEGILPDVKSAAIKLEATKFSLKSTQAEVFPKLTLSGSLGTNYSSYYSLYATHTTTSINNIGYVGNNPADVVYGPVSTTTTNATNYPFNRQLADNFGQGLSLNLTIPIYNNLIYKSDIARSKIAVKVAQLNENLTKNQLRKNIEQAYTDLLAASKNYMATKEQLVAEGRSMRDMTIKFKAGAINATDFFVEKSNFAKAELSNLQAKYDYLFKLKVVGFYEGKPITD